MGPASDNRTASADVVTQIVQRASSPGFEDWWTKVAGAGFCTQPIHLQSGPRDTVMGRCKNRRAAVCPSCSDLYAGDTWQLVHAGLAGGHGVPKTITTNPVVFATLTAPSFGAVHAVTSRSCCRPRRELCSHGKPIRCARRHADGDSVVGQPLCLTCYDYLAHVLFAWHLPELWRRFTIALRRAVAAWLRSRSADPKSARVSFVKVVEMQRRAVPHIHAVIRLDPVDEAHVALTSRELAGLVITAGASVHFDVPSAGGEVRTVRFGEQLDVQPFGDAAANPAERRKVAGYLAKYVAKSISDFGIAPRRMSAAAIDRLDVTPHVRAILRTIAQLATEPERNDMVGWLHTLAYRGHVTTKSRSYSVTMTALRGERDAWNRRHRIAPAESAQRSWTFTGAGLSSAGDRLLATTAAQRTREARWAARIELTNEPNDY